MAEKKDPIGKVIVLGPRLAFEHLYEPDRRTEEDEKTGEVKTTERWGCTLLFPKAELKNMIGIFKGKRMPVLDALRAAGKEAQAKVWGDDESKWPKLKPEKKYWRDGDLEEYDGFPGNWYASCGAKIENKPSVVTNRKDGDGNWIPASPGGNAAPYAGCYVNATIAVWAKDNKHGTRLNCEIKAVQFFRDGDAFAGAVPTNPNDDFSDDMVGEAGDFGDDGSDDTDDMV